MNSRERMLAAMRHEKPDRVPTDIWATPETMAQLRAHFGSDAEVMEQLHIDGVAWIDASYIGPPLPTPPL